MDEMDHTIHERMRAAFEDLTGRAADAPALARSPLAQTRVPSVVAAAAAFAAVLAVTLLVAKDASRTGGLRPTRTPPVPAGSETPASPRSSEAAGTATATAAPSASPRTSSRPHAPPSQSPVPHGDDLICDRSSIDPSSRSGVAVTLEADPDVVPSGTSVGITITVRNNGATPVSYQRPTSKRAVVWVNDRRETVWSSDTDMNYLQAIEDDRIFPGDERSQTFTWNLEQSGCGGPTGPAPPGSYTVHGHWETTEGPGSRSRSRSPFAEDAHFCSLGPGNVAADAA